MFRGSYTALITPFKEGMIDAEALEALIERQVAEGTHGIVPCGTTGESPTLSHEEHNELIAFCVRVAGRRIKVMAGTGSNATVEAILLTQHAERAGADGALLTTPYYNKPSQEGLYRHFKAIHDETGIPLVLYNIPGRTCVDLSNETLARLLELPRIVGMKDATCDLQRPAQLAAILAAKGRTDFVQLSGEDGTALEFNAQGGVGCISVTANLVPRLCAEMQNAWLAGEEAKAEAIQKRLQPLHDILFCETNPGPVKYAASLMGLCTEEMRLPLVPPSEENKARIGRVLAELGLV